MVETVQRSLKLGVLASGGGTNLQAVIDACEQGRIPAQVTVVISNNSGAGALERARRHGIPALHISNYHHPNDADLDAAIVQVLQKHDVDLVLFAGYMKKRGPAFLRAYPGRVLNIHPALLPRFGGKGMYGMNVHRAVLAAGEGESGASVHLVDEKYDHGPILAQRRVPVLPDDTPEDLAARVLVVEHQIYPDVIGRIARGEITLPTQ
jgi:phosphoribosylglycinamide formyltransferase-1